MNQRGYGHNGWYDPALVLAVVNELPEAGATVAAPAVVPAPAGGPAGSRSRTLSPLAEQGRSVFLTKSQPACGICHRLQDAGTTGAVGPSLDVLQPGAQQVLAAVSNGVGAMPAFGQQLSPDEIRALATYIAEVAGQ
ncbi:MAG: c-type cytochrome [Parahaliea sp.]